MREMAHEFLTPLGPSAAATAADSRIFNIALSAATNTATDLTGANYVGLLNAINGGRFLTLTASVDIWYRWATATGTVDETTTAASTPANQGILLPAGSRITERPPTGATFLIAKATPNTGTLCVQVASRSEASYVSGT